MKGLVFSLALALSVLYVQADVPLQPDFQQDKIQGKWYCLGLASNSSLFRKHAKDHMKDSFTTVLTTTDDGNVNVLTTIPKQDRCEKQNRTYIKTDVPGRFLTKNPRYGEDHVHSVVETNYDEYLLAHSTKSTGRQVFNILTMYSRNEDVSPEVIEKFRALAHKFEIGDDCIVYLEKADKCTSDD
ncbi:lipocalin-like [Hyperolius riggenbachi]|uniref:lipocalin-like n=1 Tax=Hyperolius riggenbachi TaxID=752182 RepID=UPI0035A3C64C